MDLIIILILIIGIAFIYKDFKKVVYFIGIMEIFFRLLHAIVLRLHIAEITTFVKTYIPSSLIHVLAKYSSGLLFEILVWLVIAVLCIFEFFLVKSFIKKK